MTASAPAAGAARARGRPHLSLCVIARDEAAFLDTCLDSVAGLVDEIVVVDTGSTDDTAAVARAHGARLFTHAWQDDFAAARNAGLARARGRWILCLDCDEVLARRDHAAVRAAIATAARVDAYRLTTRNYTDRRDGAGWVPCQGDYVPQERGHPGWFPTTKIRLWRHRPEVRFQGPVHELVEAAVEAVGGRVADLTVPVHHYGMVEKRRAADRYLEAGERKLAAAPDDLSSRFELAIAYRDSGRLDAALGQIEAVVRDLGAATRARRRYVETEQVHLVHGDILDRLGRLQEALAVYQALAAASPEAFQAHNNIGSLLARLGRRREALKAYRQAHRLAPDHPLVAANLAALEAELAGRSPPVSASPAVPDPAPAVHPDARLSLCMIVRDEAPRLGECLASARDVVDEIVIVDTGSTDDTVAIARAHGARIGHFTWCDDFAAARNASLRLATGDWILWLDADDRLPQEGHDLIRRLVAGPRDRAYFFVLDDRGYERVSCLQMRLFPNLEGVAFEMPIHEQVTPSLARLGLDMVPTDLCVVHTGYTTPEVVAAKKDRYLSIMERWLEDHPQDYIVRSHVALTCHTTGRLEEAARHYRIIVEESACREDCNYVVLTTALLFLGRTYFKLGDLDAAVTWLRRAEAQDDDYVLIQHTLADVLLERGEGAAAAAYAEKVLSRPQPQVTFFPIDQRELRYATLTILGRARAALGQLPAAEAALREAASLPVARRSEALGQLAEALQAAGDTEAALAALQEALRIAPEHPKHLFNAGMLHLEASRLDAAQTHFERVLDAVGPGADDAGQRALLNLGYIAKRRGDIAGAEARYRQVLDVEAQHTDAHANLGHLLLGAGRPGEAAVHFEAVLARASGLLDIELGLLRARQGLGCWDPELARRLVGAAPEALAVAPAGDLQPAGAALAFVQLGAALLHRDLPACAELAFQIAVDADPAGSAAAGARRCLAQLYFSQQRYWDAVPQLEALLRANPADADAFRRLGDTYARLGVEDAARLCYERAGASA